MGVGGRAAVSVTQPSPSDPLFFFPDGLDWRWGSVGDERQRLAQLVDQMPTEGGSRVGCFRAEPRVETLLLDEALRSAGATARPTDPAQDLASPTTPLVVAREASPRARPIWRRRAAPEEVALEVAWASDASGGAVGCDVGSASESRRWSWDSLALAVEPLRLQARAPGREVVVLDARLDRACGRLAWEWARTVGAAAVVVRTEELPAAAAWARPTAIFSADGTGAAVTRILEFARRSTPAAHRKLLHRLHTVFCVGLEPEPTLRALAGSLGFEVVAAAGPA